MDYSKRYSERINGQGNGYGRLDQMLNEYYLKYGGNYWSFGGRDINGDDATNEMSWICMEAYDITGGYNHLGLMWHEDINKDFYNYGCEVLARHNCGTPTLVNFDVLRDSQLRSGVKEEDAWNIYDGEVDRTAEILKDFKNETYR